MTVAPAPLLHRGKVLLALPEQSPLDYWRHAAPQLREATRLTNEVDEVAVRAPNNGGKTEWGTAFIVRAAQGRNTLDGIPIPRWDGRIDAIELARDYKQQKLSTQQTYLRLIGNHPHKCRWAGDDVLSSMRIRHEDSTDDEATWSLITFLSQENKRAGLGARADIIRGDEPPDREIWHEARKAAHANRRGLRLITYTPIRRPEWWWLQEEYGSGTRGNVRRVGAHWAEVRFSLMDNTVLSPARKATLIDEFTKMGSIADARIHGDFVDASGDCPFDVEAKQANLAAMLELCVPGESVQWRVSREERSEDGRTRQTTMLTVEVWALATPGASYYIVIDTASGAENGDPLGLDVYEVGSGDLVASWGGHASPYSVGVLAAGLARQYNNATIDVEVNDGWGVNVYRALGDASYGNLAFERRELRPGVWSKELGFRTNKDTRGAMIGAIQAQIEAWAAGVCYGKCPSRKHIQCLLDCVLDDSGKPVASPGLNDERMITRGQGLRRAVTRSGRQIPDLATPPRTADQDLIAAIMGEDDEAPQAWARPRARPRI